MSDCPGFNQVMQVKSDGVTLLICILNILGLEIGIPSKILLETVTRGPEYRASIHLHLSEIYHAYFKQEQIRTRADYLGIDYFRNSNNAGAKTRVGSADRPQGYD